MSEYLIHFGVKGQKWGRRNWQNYDGSYTAAGRQRYGIGERRIARSNINPNYSVQRHNRARFIYGRDGVRRINRSMNEANNISRSRSQESTRIHQARARATMFGNSGSAVGASIGSKIGEHAIKNSILLGGYVVGSMLGGKDAGAKTVSQLRDSLEANAGTKFIINTIGTAVGKEIGKNVGKSIGGEVGRSIGMYSKGYSPKLYRYGN